MFTQIRKPNHHFNAFYEDNAILIQFIVEEFIRSYQLILQIQGVIQGQLEFSSSSPPLSLSLLKILGQLVGNPSLQSETSFSYWTKGSLTKFKEYCERFSYNSLYQNKQHINLHMAVHQAWLLALNNFELLNSIYKNSPKINSELIFTSHPLKRAFHTLQMRFNQISRYIPRIMSVYWNNENVILCLLRRKSLLEEIYGSDFLYKHFKWPLNTSELMQWLLERYQARGLDSLLPTIQNLLAVEEEPIAILP